VAAAEERMGGGGLEFCVEREEAWTERFELKLECREEEGGRIRAGLAYDEERYSRGAVERLAERWRALVLDAVHDPERAIGELRVVGEQERRQVLEEWSGEEREYGAAHCIHEWFEEQAARTPQLRAVECRGRGLSYAELEERAEQVAQRLGEAGLGAESRVGLWGERSTELVVGLLGILKAGCAYVPLEASWPGERLSYVIADSGLQMILQAGAGGPAGASSCPVLRLDDPAEWKGGRKLEGRAGVHPEQLAYVIYTSGSTGRPKGVEVEHRQIVNYVRGVSERLQLESGARYALMSSFGADLGYTMLYPALTSGGCVDVVAAECAGDAEAVSGHFKARRADAMKIVPSHLRALLSGAEPESVLPRQRLVLGGEACHWELIERVRALAPGCVVLNHYGPSETTVGVVTGQLAEVAGETGAPPLGRPLGNAQVLVLDGRLEPAPIGVAGEIYIGGAGVARGYTKQAGLTAERFVPSPYAREPGARLYRSGDRGRWREDGRLEFLGRLDEQVKIRGYRVELGEIEAVLRDHRQVGQAVVIAPPTESGPVLWAYVTPAELAAAPTPAELGRHLAAVLPDYMLPAAITVLAKLPLTANGKLDRPALPRPEQLPRAAERSSLSAVQEVIAGIWSDLLGGGERVGLEDHFFQLGGHSLLATQVVSRVRFALAVDTPVRWLFENPTLAGFAARIEHARRDRAGLPAPPILPVSRDRPLPLSFAQQRLWFLDQLHPNSSFYNVSTGVRIEGALSVAALQNAFQSVWGRHEALRTIFPADGDSAVQLILPVSPIELPILDLAHLAAVERESEIARLVSQHAQQPFDLSRGPLLRIGLLHLNTNDHVLLVSLHHIVTDGWSMAILLRELMSAYESWSRGMPPAWPPLPIQYADFAAWQHHWFSGEGLDLQLAYWRRQLEGAPSVLQLPTDWPRPVRPAFEGARTFIEIPADVTAHVKILCRRTGVTMFTFMLAVFKTLLRWETRSDDIVVGTSVANRNRLESEGLIGFFVNQLVLRTNLGENPTFIELLGRVSTVVLDAYAHEDLPFEKLVTEIKPERHASQSPLYQILFKLHAPPSLPDAPAGLVLRPLPVRFSTSRFDLVLEIVDRAENLVANMEYSTELFKNATVARMLARYGALLATITERPHGRLGDLFEFLDAREASERDAVAHDFRRSDLGRLRALRRERKSTVSAGSSS
jgi:amino acid adenylation domain-containing protein